MPGEPGIERPIVVLDDEPSVLQLLRDLLEMEGFRVVCFDHPEQLPSLTHTADPCLFLIDIMLPGTSGITVAERLHAGRYNGTPLVAMSASRAMLALAQSTGLFDETLSKPFDLPDLLETVQRLVNATGRSPCTTQ